MPLVASAAPGGNNERPDQGYVRVAVGQRLHTHLDHADHGQQRDNIPPPADGQIGLEARQATYGDAHSGQRYADGQHIDDSLCVT